MKLFLLLAWALPLFVCYSTISLAADGDWFCIISAVAASVVGAGLCDMWFDWSEHEDQCRDFEARMRCWEDLE